LVKLKRHLPFLKTVLWHAVTAFGGPQGHLGMMLKRFVFKKNYITEAELVEINSFCNLLPGPGSTQTLTLIGYKRGGVVLAVLSLLIWMLPACIIMAAFSFLLTSFPLSNLSQNGFRFLEPMAVGFLVYSIVRLFGISIKNTITQVVMLVAILATFFLFKTPWVFPMLIICGGVVTNFSNKRIPDNNVVKPKKIRWHNLLVFALIFIIAGAASEYSRVKQLSNRKTYNLFENFYRFGTVVFGGGDVLLPMMLDQYVERPQAKSDDDVFRISINKDDLLTGYGFVRAIPGPVFSIGTFTGGLALSGGSKLNQLWGCFLATVALFLPSTLLLFFLYPIWNYIKKYAVVYRALEGINAVVVGIMIASALYIIQLNFLNSVFDIYAVLYVVVILAVFLTLQFTKLPAPFIVLGAIALGFIL
jgi:chromate transporter